MATLVAMFFLYACTNDPKEVKKYADTQEEPMEIQENLNLVYTDSAMLKMDLKAARAENYPQLEDPKLVFPNGIRVIFYDNFGNEDSRLKADRAINYTKEDKWEAYGNVEIINNMGEKLNTEKLFWDRKSKKLFTDSYSRLTTPDRILTGEGFEADQDLRNAVFNKPTGEIYIDEDE